MRSTIFVVALAACASEPPLESMFEDLNAAANDTAQTAVTGARAGPIHYAGPCANGGSVTANGTFEGRSGPFVDVHLQLVFSACSAIADHAVTGTIAFAHVPNDVMFTELYGDDSLVGSFEDRRDGGWWSCDVDIDIADGDHFTYAGTICGQMLDWFTE